MSRMTRSSFKSFLNEGLIKLPNETRRKLRDSVEQYLAMYAYWHGRGEVKAKAEQALSRLGVRPVKTMRDNVAFTFTVPIAIDDLPEVYKSRAGRLPRRLAVRLRMVPLRHPDTKETIAGLYEPDKARLSISADPFVVRVVDANDVHEYDAEVNAALDVADHELTHFIQDRVVRGAGEEVEFDPQLKTELGTFKRLVKHNAGTGVADERRALDVFVGNKGENAFWGVVTPATFFMRLKRENEPRWRKAVKLFTQHLKESVEPSVEPSDEQKLLRQFNSLVLHLTPKTSFKFHRGIPEVMKHVGYDKDKSFVAGGDIYQIGVILDPEQQEAVVTRTVNIKKVNRMGNPTHNKEFMEIQWMTNWLEDWAKGRRVFKDSLGMHDDGYVTDMWRVTLV